MNKLPISVTMLVKNASKYLHKSLSSLQDFAEVIILDNGSMDNSIEIAQQFKNVKIHYHDFIGFGPMKNLAAELANYDWIINIDSDEIFDPELINEISKIDFTDINKVYEILRINHYRGKAIKTCGWYPDYVKRLYHRSSVKFNDKQVHESLELSPDISVIRLNNHFLHYSFDGATALINKMQQYTTLFAEQNRFNKRASIFSAVGHGFSAFIKNYFFKKGILSGSDGFVISFANACGSYYKYVKLFELNQEIEVSLIITTYNRTDALEAVLYSVLNQEILPNEVIVADDGSTAETKDMIERLQKIFPIPLKHAWQEDIGFRLAESRNKALSMAEHEYIVIIDGDMVLHPKFIVDHKKSAKKGLFVQGGRVMLTEEKTAKLLSDPTNYRVLKWYEKGLETRIEKRLSAIRIPLLSTAILNKETKDNYKAIRGCNMAFFKEDAVAINGFNSDFIGWGREDSEFVARFFNNGGKRANIKFSAIAYHLWHNEATRASLPENDMLLEKSIVEKLKWCENGLDKV
ncbi:glycosyltransferase family 2 protein [Otariodibacter oris]|uniref:Glycosyltransferase involved in cell wall biosynthesis n=1 Tax=Otariodibacter oris TaxID=1032623 RepID=A0A420XIE7_9PAST|nr:glycosyltransferase [Otariodibacter oris]QGM80904.1 glycosyl transferase [Otariodibacter oris]RKR76921.1 glycosyltransferase involved in cell wall biosynthesis [Otariodibacter oris]